jgi:hypothetical protein
MPVAEIVLSPNASGAQDCPCEKTVNFLSSGSASGVHPENAEAKARQQMNEAIVAMEDFIAKWVRGLSCHGNCRLIEFEIAAPKGDLGNPIRVVRNKNDGSISWTFNHLVSGEGEVITYLCGWSVHARHGVLCIAGQPRAG